MPGNISTYKDGVPEHWKNLNLEPLEGEEWVPIIDWPEYMVSNMGRVKALARMISFGIGYRPIPEKMMHPTPSDDRGYLRVALSREAKSSYRYVHILVGLHFIPNPFKKRTVNHKKGIKWDNRATELEWNTYSENHKHSYEVLGRKSGLKGKTGYASATSKEVICVTTGQKYGSLLDAAKELNLIFQNISKVCKGKRHHTGGLVFKYVNE